MNILGIIPARYASSRFPGKMLADIAGKTMIQRVYAQACQAKSLAKVIVATDNELIFKHIKDTGGEAVMTRLDHPSGTDRCFEALQQTGGSFDFVVNIQGDEPFIQPGQIETLTSVLSPETELATLVKTVDDHQALFSSNEVHVVVNTRQEAIYFSRSVIPYVRGEAPENWLSKHTFYNHVGLYAYRSDVLEAITKLPVSTLERAEMLEQLRWIENGYRIKVAFTDLESTGIDTPEDLEKALTQIRNQI